VGRAYEGGETEETTGKTQKEHRGNNIPFGLGLKAYFVYFVTVAGAKA
jgi:hypothetical protein